MAQKKGNFRHGFYGTPTYKSWSEMKYRCGNENRKDYKNVAYDKRWMKFENFLEDMGERPEGKSIDRIDPFGNYEKSNCRWATSLEQNNNKKYTHLFEFNGEKHTLTNWSKIVGVKRSTLAQRIYCYNWNVDRALVGKGVRVL